MCYSGSRRTFLPERTLALDAVTRWDSQPPHGGLYSRSSIHLFYFPLSLCADLISPQRMIRLLKARTSELRVGAK